MGEGEGGRKGGREGLTRTLGSVASPFLAKVSMARVFLRKMSFWPFRICFSAAAEEENTHTHTHTLTHTLTLTHSLTSHTLNDYIYRVWQTMLQHPLFHPITH